MAGPWDEPGISGCTAEIARLPEPQFRLWYEMRENVRLWRDLYGKARQHGFVSYRNTIIKRIDW